MLGYLFSLRCMGFQLLILFCKSVLIFNELNQEYEAKEIVRRITIRTFRILHRIWKMVIMKTISWNNKDITIIFSSRLF
jgi:hypothetical protein